MLKPLTLIAALVFVVWTTFGATPPNFERALKAQLELAANNPQDPEIHNDLGNLLVEAGFYTQAENAYVRALGLEPEDEAYRFNYALLLQQTGRASEAEQQFDEILLRRPDHAWALYQKGVIVHNRDDRKQALELYAQAFASDSSLTFAANNPHIIENKLATEALLMSNRYRQAPGAKVPRVYGEADRITRLMVEDEEMEEGASEAAEDAGEDSEERAEAADSEGGRALSSSNPAPAATGGRAVGGTQRGTTTRSQARTVRPVDETRPTTPAARPRPQKRSGGGSYYIPGSSSESSETVQPEGNTRRNNRQEGRAVGRENRNRPRGEGRVQRPANQRPRPGYRPPVRSTGSLDLELIPEPPTAERTVAG